MSGSPFSLQVRFTTVQGRATNRRVVWEIAMAGGYQTTGETAKRGTGMVSNTGGGWVNGRGDDTLVMLKSYAHMVHFLTSFEWWKAIPTMNWSIMVHSALLN